MPSQLSIGVVWENRPDLLGLCRSPFGSKQLAEKAYVEGHEKYEGRSFKKTRDMTPQERQEFGEPLEFSISVDAACNHKGDMGYRGVFTYSSDEIFKNQDQSTTTKITIDRLSSHRG